jgi:hypothetical protein
MMTLVEVVACRHKLREADALLAQVRGSFIVAQDASGARLANDAIGLISDLMRMLDAAEHRLAGYGQGGGFKPLRCFGRQLSRWR